MSMLTFYINRAGRKLPHHRRRTLEAAKTSCGRAPPPPERQVSMKPFTSITVFILAVFGLVHLLRLIGGWSVTVNEFEVPMGVSIAALVVSWALAALVWREHRP
jgi:uncharacterized protein DUF3175